MLNVPNVSKDSEILLLYGIFCLLYGLKSRICTIEVYGRSTQPTHPAQAEAYFVEFHLYIILLKRPEEKFCTVLRSFLLPQNRETAYSQLVKFLKARKPISEWSKPFLQQAWRLFCTPDKTGAYREYVGVYEYWLKHWMKK